MFKEYQKIISLYNKNKDVPTERLNDFFQLNKFFENVCIIEPEGKEKGKKMVI